MILASQSPRRKEILERAHLDFTIHPADINEDRIEGESPTDLVRRLAHTKAHAVQDELRCFDEVILAADTIVWQGDDVFGKPHDAADAIRMLKTLSGATHHVSTGVCLISGAAESTFVETTDVRFRELADQEIEAYVACGEPADKAGAYAIQGGAHGFVDALDGDYDNVVGLPIRRVLEELSKLTPNNDQLNL